MNLLKRIFRGITKHAVPFKERVLDRKLLDVPNRQLIWCEVESPQFCGSDSDYWMLKQTGTFDRETLLFTHDGWIKGHDIQFASIEQFQKALLKLL